MKLEFKRIKSIGVYLASEFINKGLSFILIPIFANLLAPDEYSKIGSFTVIYTLLVLAYGMNFNASVLIIRHERKFFFESIFITNLIMIYLWMILLSCVIYAYSYEIAILVGVDMTTLFLASSSAFFSVLLFNTLALYQSAEESVIYSALSMAKSLITFFFAILFTIYLDNEKFFGYMYGQALGAILLFIISLYLLSSIKLDNFDIRYAKYLFFVSIPLVPHTLSGVIYSQYDRVIIQNYLGNVESGIYFYSVSFLLVMQTFIAALNVGWSPIMLKLIGSNSTGELKIYYNLLSKLVLGASLSIIVWAREIVMLTSSPEYIEAFKLIPIFSFAGYIYFLAIMYININLFSKKTIYISGSSVIIAICSYYFNLHLVVAYGPTGVAYVSFGSILLLLFFNILISNKFLDKKRDAVISLGYFVKDLALLILVFTFFHLIDLNSFIDLSQRVVVYLMLMAFVYIHIVRENLSRLKRFS